MKRLVIALVLAFGARGAIAQPSIDPPPEHTEPRTRARYLLASPRRA